MIIPTYRHMLIKTVSNNANFTSLSKAMKLQLNVPNMACGSCAKAITNAVKSIDQGAKVEADPKTKRVNVETESSEADIREAIKGAGYDVS